MLRKLAFSVSVVLMAVLTAAPAAMAQDKVEGSFDLLWNDCWEGPSEAVPDWIGTADIDGDVYDMIFFNLGTGRPPNHALEEPEGSFIEIWAIYDGLEITFDDGCAMETFEGDLVMWGHDYGVANMDAAEYAMTGTVVEAMGPFDGFAASDISMSGTFFVNEDGKQQAPGTFQIG